MSISGDGDSGNFGEITDGGDDAVLKVVMTALDVVICLSSGDIVVGEGGGDNERGLGCNGDWLRWV